MPSMEVEDRIGAKKQRQAVVADRLAGMGARLARIDDALATSWDH